ncbi:proliferation marker protein Ki-67 isoform X2 [Pungitius pungitius]|uniref:proliferation marker protein Ki-67 isoform X2 n=1 Tax=Pungitius pungitius TaxID=134920 RepID=UPI002E142E29
MPLHGKIVVIKRSGADGTEFPLTASCLFGRKPDCDIRIQLPQVSKEHCRIDFNENKEIILTNLSSVNPTRVNGEALQQAERLKHGDVITVIDRSFRFEYPPAPTPKKRSSIGGQTETLKVLNQQVGGAVTTETGEKRTSEVSTDPHLKDGTNHENIQRPLETSAEAGEPLQTKTASPFSDLYQMIKQSLDVKTPRKSSATVPPTPASRFCSPRPGSVASNDEKPVPSTEDNSTREKDEADVSSVADDTVAEPLSDGTPKSAKKQRRSFKVPSTETSDAENAVGSEAASTPKRSRTPPKRFTACEAASPKSPVRRRSKEAKPAQEEAVTSPEVDPHGEESPESPGEHEMVKVMTRKRKSEELGGDLPVSQMKRKRVSFGGFLCPELFDKRLPPNSPLQKGAAPRRSLSVSQPKQSLLRRASTIGLLQSKNASPSSGKTSPKSRSPSPKAVKSKSPSPAPGSSSTVQGRFSVSHICTPSPIAEDAAGEQGPFVRATPKITPRRRSLSRTRSGISRASMKVQNSWAEIVRFGQTKVKPAAAAKKTVAKKTAKKTVAKPQTPARNLCAHVGTGHADSPVTIVVGRAHRQNVPPTGAAPKVVPNIALLKKNMKMDEDLTGISEMLKTPANEKRKTSVMGESSVKTPAGSLCPSVMNTPEEPGEMMVSPLTVSSTVKDRSYNSEAVQRLFNNDQECSVDGGAPAVQGSSQQPCAHLTTTAATPKQKAELPECLTGVKRMMRTPRQRAEPLEDLRGNILKTPKQKPEEQECLSGVKRMMETPRQEAAPVEDIAVERREALADAAAPQPEAADALVETPADLPEPEDPVESSPAGERLARAPKEKSAPVEDMVGVKRLMKTPREKGRAVEEDFGIDALVETPGAPLQGPGEAQPDAEASEVVEEMPQDCEEDVAKELVFALEEPQDDVPSDVGDVPQVDKEDIEVAVDDHLEKCGAAVEENSSVETPEEETVDEKLPEEEQPEEDAVPEVDTAATEPHHEKSLKTAESLAAEACDEAVAPAPVRARRGKKSDATAPPAVRHATRGRTAKPQESAADDQPEQVTETSTQASPVEEESSPPEEEAVLKTPRGRKSKPDPVEQSEDVEDESLTADAAPQKSMEKPRRGRKAKPKAVEQSEVAEDVAMETKQQPQPPVRAKRGRAAKQEEEEKPESSLKPKRGRTTIPADEAEQPYVPSSHREDAADEAAEVCSAVHSDENQSSDAVEAAPQAPAAEREPDVETATGKVPETDAAAQKKSARGRKAQLEDKQEAAEACDEAVAPAPVRARRGKKSDATAPPAVRHATRGRTAKPQESAADDQPEQVTETSTQASPVEEESSPPEEEAVVKTPRGRKSKPDPVEQSEDESLTADAAPQKSMEKPRRGRKAKPKAVEQSEVAEDVAMETKLQPQPPVRAKRGRAAKQEEEEKPESSSVETTKPQEPAKKVKRTKKVEQEPVEEAPAVVVDVPKEAEVKMTEQATVATKPKRGGRRAAEVQEVPATDKLKRGKRGKQAPEEGGATSVEAEEKSDHVQEAEEKKQPEPEAPVMKPSRARGAKAAVKNEVPKAVPAKKARRGAAPLAQEPLAEATVPAPEPAAASVEPAKRGRRAAPKAAALDDPSAAAVEDTKTFKRTVRWKEQLEVVEIQKQVDAESKNVAKDADPTEEKDLSGKAAEAQPAKKTRRGPKVAVVTADDAESTSGVESVEAESLPKTRRGRAAKK